MKSARYASLAAAFIAIISTSCPAFVSDAGGLATLMVSGFADYEKDYTFYVYYPGALTDTAKIVDDWWRRVDMEGAPEGKPVHVKPPSLGYGSGDLALIAVPKKLAEQNPVGEATWFTDKAPVGILRVKGELKVIVLYSSHGNTVLDYRLDRIDGEFVLTLLNPGRLLREHESDAEMSAPDSNSPWIMALIGAGAILLVFAIVSGMRGSNRGRN